jgi:hypothetical protein
LEISIKDNWAYKMLSRRNTDMASKLWRGNSCANFSGMSRSAIAFLVAPLWVPLLVTPYCYLFVFPYAEQRHWVVIGAVVSAIFSYGGTLSIGIPTFSVLRAYKMTTIWMAIAVGFVIGAASWIAFLALFMIFLHAGSVRGLGAGIHEALADPKRLMLVLWLGAMGSVVGSTLWLIARPDRSVV